MNLRRGAWLGLMLLALASTSSLIVAAYSFLPLSVDGGWASYGGFAIAADRDPYLHQGTIEEMADAPGVKAMFAFDTVSNTRALYTSLWFGLWGASWGTIKVLAMLELAFVIAVAGLFFRRALPSADLAILATALLATDKTFVMMAAADFRPDLVQAGFGCLFYLALREAPATRVATLGLTALAVFLGMMSTTVVTPIAIAAAARAVEVLGLRGEDRAYQLRRLALAVCVAAGSYLARLSAFPVLLGTDREVVNPVSTGGRIAEIWAGGIPAVAAKELFRWESYLVGSNLPILGALLVLAAVWILSRAAARVPWKDQGTAWAGVLTGLGIVVLVDPHDAPNHLAPVMPYILLLVGRTDQLPERARRSVVAALATLVVAASLLGFVLSRRVVSDAASVGFSNEWLAETLNGLKRDNLPLVVAGGTEFWPYWDSEADVTIVDLARTVPEVDLLEPTVPHLQYAILSADYATTDWLGRVGERYGVSFRILVAKTPFVVIADGFPTDPTDPSAGAEARP